VSCELQENIVVYHLNCIYYLRSYFITWKIIDVNDLHCILAVTAEEEIAEDEPEGMDELIEDDEGDCFYFNLLW
jgi:hypothetical protein